MKKIILALICATVLFVLAGCTAVNSDNSFQSQAPGEVTITQGAAEQPTATQQPDQGTAFSETTDTPTQEPIASGYNG